MIQGLSTSELVVDLFAGAGGASEGIRAGLGRDPDVAINHDEAALAAHEANHPATRHLRGNVWAYAPRDVVGDVPVGLLWASPTCTHFSRAKGAPLDRREATRIRALAWVVTRWAREVRPRVVLLENVEAFADWGPLLSNGRPCPARKGLTFRRWVKSLRDEGYAVEWRELRASDYGAPTSRKRLFVIARRDGRPIVWPMPTHGRGLRPYRSAAECIDWSIPVPSIFGRAKPLAEPTLRRIARGLRRFVIESDRPFIVGSVAPSLVHVSNGERKGQAPRVYDIEQPLGTVVAGGVKHALVAAYIAKHYGGHEGPGQSLTLPLGTVTCRDHHALVTASAHGDRREEVRAFLTQYNGTSVGQPLQLPLNTVTTRDRFGLVTVHGEAFEIRDIGMRMLTPRELARAQGFPDSYVLDPIVRDKRLGPTGQVRLIGNSVPPALAAALVRANVAGAEEVAA
jgi:DNA (cytosine-5)-methyltransferase 1